LPEELTILNEHWEEMAADVSQRAPEEACELVAGMQDLTSRVFPIPNELHSRVRFRMEPRAQLDALLEIDAMGSELLAIYHSHPSGPARPSPTDIEEAAYPGVIHLIWHLQAGVWECSGYLVEEDQVYPVVIRQVASSEGGR
jgi:proteasome lid subunit RPN8/RPN11